MDHIPILRKEYVMLGSIEKQSELHSMFPKNVDLILMSYSKPPSNSFDKQRIDKRNMLCDFCKNRVMEVIPA